MVSNRAEPDSLAAVQREVAACRRCPRLVTWREEVARTGRASYAGQVYWGRGVPGFGDPHASLVLVGLAPAAHGANRTGRMFTGDRSGDWLFAALHRAGFASQPTSTSRDDGLTLTGGTSPPRCTARLPANKPEPAERAACAPYLARELSLLHDAAVVVALGQVAWQAVASQAGLRPRPSFGHLAESPLPGGLVMFGSYHPSQQNTFTGKLTVPMFDAVFTRPRRLIEPSSGDQVVEQPEEADARRVGRDAVALVERPSNRSPKFQQVLQPSGGHVPPAVGHPQLAEVDVARHLPVAQQHIGRAVVAVAHDEVLVGGGARHELGQGLAGLRWRCSSWKPTGIDVIGSDPARHVVQPSATSKRNGHHSSPTASWKARKPAPEGRHEGGPSERHAGWVASRPGSPR